MRMSTCCLMMGMRIAPCLGVMACGARTGLDVSEQASSKDAAIDVTHDTYGDTLGEDSRWDVHDGADATQDTPHEASPDTSAKDAGMDAGHDADAAHKDDASHDALDDVGPGTAGCADGDREGFVDLTTHADIAGCSGGWSVPGVMLESPGTAPECPSVPTFDTASPACGRTAGNHSPNPSGGGCNVADLCADGWHVCTGAADIAAHSPSGCKGATLAGDPPLFFTSRQSSNGCEDCATGTGTGANCNSSSCTTGCAQTANTSNDVFGCGNLGDPGPFSGGGPLDRFTYNECGALAGTSWSCTDDGSGNCEAFVIVHGGADHGGVLCCRD